MYNISYPPSIKTALRRVLRQITIIHTGTHSVTWLRTTFAIMATWKIYNLYSLPRRVPPIRALQTWSSFCWSRIPPLSGSSIAVVLISRFECTGEHLVANMVIQHLDILYSCQEFVRYTFSNSASGVPSFNPGLSAIIPSPSWFPSVGTVSFVLGDCTGPLWVCTWLDPQFHELRDGLVAALFHEGSQRSQALKDDIPRNVIAAMLGNCPFRYAQVIVQLGMTFDWTVD